MMGRSTGATTISYAGQRTGEGRMTMTTTQTTVDARTARELAADLDLDCIVTTEGDDIVIDFGGGAVETFSTLADAVDAIREYAKH